jgi:hypothetical protein
MLVHYYNITSMLKHLPFLSVLLLLVACGKDTPTPAAEPELLGRWNADGFTAYNYSASGQLLSQKRENYYYMLVTRDTVYYRNIRDGSSLGKEAYTRQGNSIQYPRATVTITELTDHALTLRYKDQNQKPGATYQEVEDHYNR